MNGGNPTHLPYAVTFSVPMVQLSCCALTNFQVCMVFALIFVQHELKKKI